MIWILMIVLIFADQISKYLIASDPALYNVEIIKNFFYITYVKNTGAAWSILAGHTAFLSVLSGVAIVGMLVYMEKLRKEKNTLSLVALALMVAGAAGNLLDRLMYGYVRDFLNFYIFGYDFPVFNVADICLTVGVGLLILSAIFEKETVPVEPEVIDPKKDRTGV